MEATVFYLLMPQKYINSKQKTPYPLSLENNSKDFTVNNMTKNRTKWKCLADIQLLRYHKMTKNWTSPLLSPCSRLFDFGNSPPANVQNFTPTPSPSLTKIVNRAILYIFTTTCCNQHL